REPAAVVEASGGMADDVRADVRAQMPEVGANDLRRVWPGARRVRVVVRPHRVALRVVLEEMAADAVADEGRGDLPAEVLARRRRQLGPRRRVVVELLQPEG